MKTFLRSVGWLVGLAVMVAGAAAAEPAPKSPFTITAQAERAGAIYRKGETIAFIVRVERDGQPVNSGQVEWALTKDGLDPLRTGKAKLARGEARVTATLDEPGFLQCRVLFIAGKDKVHTLAGAAVSPLEIRPSAPVPDDFDAFWSAQKAALAAIPVDARLTPVKSPREGVEAFDLQAACVGAPVSGYLARPTAAKPRSLPAILTVHGAGVGSSDLGTASGWAKEGALALDINAHGLPNGRDKAFYEALAAGDLKNYRTRGRESRESIYFLGMFLRVIRALDVLAAQPEWDGRTLVVSGSSQGGFQALAAAGLDARVTFFGAGVPAGCDHTGALAGRIAGWPKFIPTAEKSPPPEVVKAVRYFDAVNFAARAKAPGFFTVGFIDATCPPTSVYAAYNALKTPKEIFNDVAAGHTNTPAARAAMRAAVLKHFAENAGRR